MLFFSGPARNPLIVVGFILVPFGFRKSSRGQVACKGHQNASTRTGACCGKGMGVKAPHMLSVRMCMHSLSVCP